LAILGDRFLRTSFVDKALKDPLTTERVGGFQEFGAKKVDRDEEN